MANDNLPDSKNDVYSTIGPVMQVFIRDAVQREMPDCSYVYDPDLSYESAIQAIRDRNNKEGKTTDLIPMFAWKRNVLRYPEDGKAPNRRLQQKKVCHTFEDGSTGIFTALHAEFEVEFLYISKSMEDLEKFEITYMSETNFSGTKELTLHIPELGDFKYFVHYNELIDILNNNDNNYYKAVLGSAVIRGMFLTFQGEAVPIKEITTNFNSFLNDVSVNQFLESCVLIPEDTP